MPYPRKYPIGAEVSPDGGTYFRVWAPRSPTVAVEMGPATPTDAPLALIPLEAEGNGYFTGNVAEARAGMRYRFRLAQGSFPDPASRFQPDGPHGPSQIVDPAFDWTDTGWRGRPVRELVIYELHLGTFTAAGTWRGAMEQLPSLAQLGITMIEVMPVAEFPGRFGWGYDGVGLFSPTRLYGRPEEARAFVNRAHKLGIMVILDVVYNHFGPDGNYLGEFSSHYFSKKYANEWGDPLNFDGDNAAPVREFFLTNARYWIEEFHLDGLRLDATQQIFDASPTPILTEIADAAHAAGGERNIWVVGENEAQLANLIRPRCAGGCGLDALWSDDFHHAATVAATARAEAYYSGYRGTAQEFVSAAKYGFLYQGQWYAWQKRRRGHIAFDLSPLHFVHFLQNHDQVANSLDGRRLHELTSPAKFRALTALLLLSPQIPLLFQGQEFAASAPFLYFADHHPALNQQVAAGRRNFLHQFASIATEACSMRLTAPGEEETFRRCQLDFTERTKHEAIYRLHEDLLRLRQSEPAITGPTRFDGAVLGERAFVLRYFTAEGRDRILVVNLGTDLWFNPSPEPLLAPIEGHGWRIVWSSEAPEYGGRGTPPVETKANWILPGETAVLLTPDENREPPHAKLSEKN